MTHDELVGQLHGTLSIADATIEIIYLVHLTLSSQLGCTYQVLPISGFTIQTRLTIKRNDSAMHLFTPWNLPHKNTLHSSLNSAVLTLNDEAHGMDGAHPWVPQPDAATSSKNAPTF